MRTKDLKVRKTFFYAIPQYSIDRIGKKTIIMDPSPII
jgi:hypothetical protein